MDNQDSSGNCGFSVIPLVDLYIKKQILKDLNLYEKNYWGRILFKDYFNRLYFDFSKELQKTINTDLFAKKVILGWNLGVTKSLYRWLNPLFLNFKIPKVIDVSCRVAVREDPIKLKIHSVHRKDCLNKLKILDGKFKIVSSDKKISRINYLLELKRSKICVSPFGYGEICWRDFEAILCGALLIKPSMEHLQTEPNIYVPYKTYVPVRWDLNNLEEKCEYYLKHPEERKQIVKNAIKAYRDYFKEEKFLKTFEEILRRLEFLD